MDFRECGRALPGGFTREICPHYPPQSLSLASCSGSCRIARGHFLIISAHLLHPSLAAVHGIFQCGVYFARNYKLLSFSSSGKGYGDLTVNSLQPIYLNLAPHRLSLFQGPGKTDSPDLGKPSGTNLPSSYLSLPLI